MWCTWIGHPSEKLWPFEFFESFRSSISSVWISDAPESDIRLKSYDHLPLFNFERLDMWCAWIGHPTEKLWPFTFVQFWASGYVMRLNRTSEWKVMTIGISRELPSFNFERLDMWCAWIGHPSENLWPFEFLESFRCSISSVWICDAPESDIRLKSYDHLNFSRATVVQLWVSGYVMRLNQTSEWKVMTILISRELPLFNFERLEMWCALIGHPSEKVMTIWISRELPFFNFELLYMWYAWIGHPSEKVMTIWISRKLPLFNFERLYMRRAWIRNPSQKLWPFEFLESFRCSISSVSTDYVPESDIHLNSLDHLNFSGASVVQFRASRRIMRSNRTSIWIV